MKIQTKTLSFDLQDSNQRQLYDFLVRSQGSGVEVLAEVYNKHINCEKDFINNILIKEFGFTKEELEGR